MRLSYLVTCFYVNLLYHPQYIIIIAISFRLNVYLHGTVDDPAAWHRLQVTHLQHHHLHNPDSSTSQAIIVLHIQHSKYVLYFCHIKCVLDVFTIAYEFTSIWNVRTTSDLESWVTWESSVSSVRDSVLCDRLKDDI